MSAELEPLLWPLAATIAVVCCVRWRSARRRVAMNRALHELRRPLQALALAPPVGAARSAEHGSLDLALIALDDLEGVINGFERPLELRTACARSLVTESVERWRVPSGAAAAFAHPGMERRQGFRPRRSEPDCPSARQSAGQRHRARCGADQGRGHGLRDRTTHHRERQRQATLGPATARPASRSWARGGPTCRGGARRKV